MAKKVIVRKYLVRTLLLLELTVKLSIIHCIIHLDHENHR